MRGTGSPLPRRQKKLGEALLQLKTDPVHPAAAPEAVAIDLKMAWLVGKEVDLRLRVLHLDQPVVAEPLLHNPPIGQRESQAQLPVERLVGPDAVANEAEEVALVQLVDWAAETTRRISFS